MSIVTTMAHAICEDMGDVWELAFDDRQQQRICKAPDGSYRDINRPQKGEYIEAARAALRSVKPEDVSDRMVDVFNSEMLQHIGDLRSGDERKKSAIAAAIAAGADQ